MTAKEIYKLANELSFDEFKHKYYGEDIPQRVNELIDKVSAVDGISFQRITGRSRKPDVVAARHALFMLLKQETDYTAKKIGSLANRNHATVLYALARVNEATEKTDYNMWIYKHLFAY